MNKKSKILFITILLPYPLDMGAKIKTYNTLRILSELYDIDLICYVDSKNDLGFIKEIEKNLCISVDHIRKKIFLHKAPLSFLLQILKSLFSKYPYRISKFSNFLMRRKVSQKLSHNKYKLIYYDHMQSFQHCSHSKLKRNDVLEILDQQNCESEIIARKLSHTRNIFYRIFLKVEYLKLSRYERKACSSADLVMAISNRDAKIFKSISDGKCNCLVSPLYVESRENIYSYMNGRQKNILFLGSMYWFPNVDGLLWFNDNVFEKFKLKEEGWKLIIVGNNPVPEIVKLHDNKSVIVTGYVDKIEPYIKYSLVSIVPLRIGGGIRIKILDLLSYGMPIISTLIGCEGISVVNGENILIANSAEEFNNDLNLIYDDDNLRRKLSENAFKFINNEYSYSSAKEKYSKILEKY